MILQKFISTKRITNYIMNKCFNEKFDEFLDEIAEMTYGELDKMIFSLEHSMFSLMDKISKIKYLDSETVTKIIKKLSPEEHLFLFICFNIALYYQGYHVPYFTFFPIGTLYYDFFAYIQLVYRKFKSHCLKNNLSFSHESLNFYRESYGSQNS